MNHITVKGYVIIRDTEAVQSVGRVLSGHLREDVIGDGSERSI